MKNNYTYTGAIRLKSGGHFVQVSCEANNPSQAKRIIQSQYDLKSWAKQMSRN